MGFGLMGLRVCCIHIMGLGRMVYSFVFLCCHFFFGC